MQLRNFFLKSTLFFVFITLISAISPAAYALDYPETAAASAVLVDGNSGQVLFDHNSQEKVYPASTTKIMTALLTLEAIERGEISLSDVVTVTSSYNRGLSDDGSSANIQEGEELTVEDLLYCALLASANEACNVLAEYVSGSILSFVELMNTRAEELGCVNTNFINPHGMPDDNHYTTAWDLYLISKQALSNSTFVDITNTAKKTIPLTNMSEIRELENTNFLMDPSSEYYYEYASGVKTGYTKAAGYCLVSTATKYEINIIAVVMGVGRVTDESSQPSSTPLSFPETKALYEWAFENYGYYEVLTTDKSLASVPVSLGEDADSVAVKIESNVTMLLPHDYDKDSVTYELTIDSEEKGTELEAPITAGQVLGKVTVTYGDITVGPLDVVAKTNIDFSRVEYMKNEIGKTFSSIWVKLAIVVIVLLIILYFVYVIKVRIRKNKRKKQRQNRH